MRLPIEVCERIIDWSVVPDRQWWEGRDLASATESWVREHSQLLKYTVICRQWVPRTRVNLYHTVAFADLMHFELFCRTITQTPTLADMVRELIMLSRSDRYACIPITRSTVRRALRNLSTLIYDFGWQALGPDGEGQITWPYPPHYHAHLSRFPITELVLQYPKRAVSPRVWVESFRVIWSLGQLQTLHLDLRVERDVDADVGRVLSAIRRPGACGRLKTLILAVDCCSYLPASDLQGTSVISNFGTSVTHLSLRFRDLCFSEKLMTQIVPFKSLQELYVSMHDSPFNVPRKGPRVPHPFCHPPPFPPVPANNIPHSMFAEMFPSRELFLRSCSSFSAGLLGFPELRLLRADIPEPYGSRYDAEWWQRQLSRCLPELSRVTPITVNVYWPDRDNWDNWATALHSSRTDWDWYIWRSVPQGYSRAVLKK